MPHSIGYSWFDMLTMSGNKIARPEPVEGATLELA